MDSSAASLPVRSLAAALAALEAADPADQPGGQAVEDLRALLSLNEQLQVIVLDRLCDMDLRRLHDHDAIASTAAWLESQETSVDRRSVQLARRLGRLPGTCIALSEQRISVATAQRVGWAVERVRGFLDRPDGLIDGLPAREVLDAVIIDGVCMLVGEALGGIDDNDPRLRRLSAEVREIAARSGSEVERVEAAFLALAGRVERRFLASALQRLVDALLPQQLEDRSDKAHRNRGLVLIAHEDRPGGRVEADLDAEAFELLHAALAAVQATDPENVTDTSVAAGLRDQGIDPYLPGPGIRPRSAMARRHDGLVRILQDWLSSGIAGSRGKVVPHISVIAGLDTLHGSPGALPALGGSGATLAARLVRRWTCDSWVSRFVLSLGHRVVETSHTERTLKAHERRAKTVETGGRCQAGGCGAPPGSPLVPHHPDAWSRTHRTSFYDAVMFCERCHHDLHEGGRTVRLRDGRLLSPDGWIPQIAVA